MQRIFQPMERDELILSMVSSYRFVLTGQVKRRIFYDNKDNQVPRRRLKRLCDARFLDFIEPTRNGKGSTERIFYITKIGAEYVQERFPGTHPVLYSKNKNINYPWLKHAISVSEFRLSLELALENHPFVQLKRFTSEFELHDNPRNFEGMHKHKLYWTFSLPNKVKTFVMYPDAMILLQGTGEFSKEKILLFLEVDRGTERLQLIRDKVTGYTLFQEKGLHKQFGVDKFTVLFQCTSAKRSTSIIDTLFNFKGADMVWVTDRNQVQTETVLNHEIWTDCQNQKRVLLKM